MLVVGNTSFFFIVNFEYEYRKPPHMLSEIYVHCCVVMVEENKTAPYVGPLLALANDHNNLSWRIPARVMEFC